MIDSTRADTPSDELVSAFSSMDLGSLSDVLSGLGLRCTTTGLRPLHESMRVCGRALTMRYVPSRNRSNWYDEHKGWPAAQALPGDIIVVDAGGMADVSPIGSNNVRSMKAAGLGGVIIDGAIRDSAEIIELGFSAFSRSLTVSGSVGCLYTTCVKSEPIQLGTIMVAPNDIILADGDGIVVVPAGRAEEILHLTKNRATDETEIQNLLGQGFHVSSPEVKAVLKRILRAQLGRDYSTGTSSIRR